MNKSILKKLAQYEDPDLDILIFKCLNCKEKTEFKDLQVTRCCPICKSEDIYAYERRHKKNDRKSILAKIQEKLDEIQNLKNQL